MVSPANKSFNAAHCTQARTSLHKSLTGSTIHRRPRQQQHHLINHLPSPTTLHARRPFDVPSHHLHDLHPRSVAAATRQRQQLHRLQLHRSSSQATATAKTRATCSTVPAAKHQLQQPHPPQAITADRTVPRPLTLATSH